MARLLKIGEVQEALSVGRSTVYQLINRGALKAVKLGRSLRVPDVEVDRLIERLMGEPGTLAPPSIPQAQPESEPAPAPASPWRGITLRRRRRHPAPPSGSGTEWPFRTTRANAGDTRQRKDDDGERS